MSQIVDKIYIWEFSVNSEIVLLLAFVKYTLLPRCIFSYFLELVTLVWWGKIVQNLLVFVYLFCPDNNTNDFRRTFITREWLVVERWPTPRWIASLMLHLHKLDSLISMNYLAWRAYYYHEPS